jgi:hypothetical protein
VAMPSTGGRRTAQDPMVRSSQASRSAWTWSRLVSLSIS